ncbi:MAG: SH3 domain-containing protein [Pseudomonadota bacterium]|nr:SH3 domain-containing protein [Pseudomonadota bacterium]
MKARSMVESFIKLTAAVALVFAMIPSANAQSEADFIQAFAGTWQTLDPNFTQDGACRVVLNEVPLSGRYGLTAQNCSGLMSQLTGWGIVANQLGLIGANGAVIARLGGNQNRVSGQTANGRTVIFERIPDGSNAPASDVPPTECTYFGYTASCAEDGDFQRPTAEEGAAMTAKVLVKLNARSEARPNADILASIPQGTCVRVAECTTASDGNWCRAKIGDTMGWIRQRALRLDRWPVLTYTTGCNAD